MIDIKGEFMRLILSSFIVFAFIVVGCCQDRDLHIVWDQYNDQNDAEQVEYFVSYKWQGPDSSLFDPDSMTVVDTVQQDLQANKFSSLTTFSDGLAIRASCVAYDSLGRGSDPAYTRFYNPPEIPKNIHIRK